MKIILTKSLAKFFLERTKIAHCLVLSLSFSLSSSSIHFLFCSCIRIVSKVSVSTISWWTNQN